MKRNYLIALVLVGLLGCNSSQDETDMTRADPETGQTESTPPEMMLGLDDFTKQQAKPLEEAAISVKGAYNYKGFSYLEPTEAEKLVAVDVEFSNYREDFDIDDVGIINDDEKEVYGIEPNVVLLNVDGEIVREDSFWPEAPGPVRVLLIYALPKESKSLKLEYWERIITDRSIELKDGGPVLKNPEKQEGKPDTPAEDQRGD